MSLLDKKTRVAGAKLIVFIVVTTLATGVLVVLIGNFTFGSSRTYQAEFTDATGVNKGDDVRIAGVKVGSVKNVSIVDRTKAMVTFKVLKDATVTRSSTATIRYRNLVGQRYISMTQGVGNTSLLPAGSVIPLSRTQPALDLSLLFNGFKPLFAALSPTDVNKLSYEIVQVFQGEGSNIEGLLANTSSITQTLASRDKVIGSLITNLNDVLATVSSRDSQLTSLIIRLKQFVGGLNGDKQAILGSLDSISNLAEQTADLTTGIRPSLKSDVTNLKRVAGNLNQGRDEINRALQVLPIKLNKIGRTAIYGSFFNFYLCNFKGSVTLPGVQKPVNIDYNVGSARCSLG
jgi:phospholipid/cholesterol/gamma-HCH transport system substrate-binding protein